MDTPLRQVHFLAQVGHGSGSFRYAEELASGAA
jgi:putative chitinase